MNEIRLTIHPFEMDTLKEAAKKVQEEAGEAFAEYVIMQEQQDRSTTRLADEIADTIQASCNLAARYGIDLQAAMERCEQRNRSRGRYPMEEVNNAKAAGTCGCDDCDCGGDCGAVSLGVDDLPKSPEEMSAGELYEALSQALDFCFSCTKLVTDAWCKAKECISCKRNLLDLLKAAYEREIAELTHELDNERHVSVTKKVLSTETIRKLNREITDLTHERDGLKRRLEELSDAGIMSLHRLLRETIGDAKNITDAARNYVEKARESQKYDSERKAVIERLRELDFTQNNVTLHDIGHAVLGHETFPWWNSESRVELRDKLIELISDEVQDG